MLIKLSLTGIKGRLRDYLVLFSGLVVASGIFYMFEAIAANEAFLKANSTIKMISFVFQFGSVLLAIITLVYILYANSFLMTIRQKEYAMFMMLGAKTRKIAQLIFIETFVVGVLATLVGSIVGVGLTTIVSKLLVSQLDLSITKFATFNPKGLLITLAFFAILFLLAALLNAISIVKKPVLTLLQASTTPTRLTKKKGQLVLEAIVGVILLAIGYYVMSQLVTLQLLGVAIALITIVLGSYLMFHSVIIALLARLKKAQGHALKGLNNFTLSQLSFRIRDYTQMLSLVSILFALALGALVAGLGFHSEINRMVKGASAYDLVLNNAQTIDQAKVERLKPTANVAYDQKETDKIIYYVKEQFDKQPLLAMQLTKNNGDYQEIKYDGAALLAGKGLLTLGDLELPEQQNKTPQFVTREEFNQLPYSTTKLQVVKVNDFIAQKGAIKDLVELNVTHNPALAKEQDSGFQQKYTVYTIFNSLSSGLEFMGFFLGIAFLTMLASCLMFKILSGAKSDTERYAMLEKIGAKRGLLRGSIRKELAVLFLAPGILGIIDVLFGLQMFTSLLSNPYHQIWLPILIFVVLYGIYYGVTVLMYSSIVLKKEAVTEAISSEK